MYVFVLILSLSGHATVPGPLPRFDSEQACHAFGDAIVHKLREQAQLGTVLGQCLKLRVNIEGSN